MSEAHPQKEHPKEENGSDSTWTAPQGFPVYGYNRNAPPPELQRPWDFTAPKELTPEEPPQQENHWQPQQAPPPQQYEQPEAQQPPHAPPPPPYPQPYGQVAPPWPVGPALTPEERYYQIFGAPYSPPEQQPPHE